jgi:hypothetical protein
VAWSGVTLNSTKVTLTVVPAITVGVGRGRGGWKHWSPGGRLLAKAHF